ncbi:MAG: RHS repeat-associated core domain-containing protein [Myxococcota bacterium]
MAIDLATGTMSLESTDVALFGIVPVEVTRRYSIADRGHHGLLGPGWRWTFDYRVRRTLEGFSYTTDSGDEIPFVEPSDAAGAQRIFHPGAQLELRRTGPDEVEIIGYGGDRLPHQLVFTKINRLDYRLSAARNTSGARADFEYDEAGRIIVARQHRERRELRFAYDRQGHLASVYVTRGVTPLGVHYLYTYDDLGRLVQVADHDGPLNAYAYDGEGRITSESRRSGSVYQFAYDGSHRCVHVRGVGGVNERTLSYDVNKRVTEERDSHGQAFRHEYDDSGQIVKTVSPTGAVRTIAYDDQGRISVRVFEDQFSIGYKYDDWGRCVEVHYPRKLVERYEFDSEHNLVACEDFRGLRTTFERNDRGLMTALVLPDGRRLEREYDSSGDIVLMRDPEGGETSFAYDAYGKVIAKQNPMGMIWRYEYNELGLMTRSVDPLGGQTQLEYDSQQRISLRRAPDGTTSTYRYDNAETMVSEQRSDGAHRYIRYSTCGQPLEVCDYAGNVTHFEWDTEQWRMLAMQTANGGRHQFAYNGDGDLVEHVSPAGRVKKYEWRGRQLVASTDAAGRRVEREYDDLGYLTKLKSVDGDIEYHFDKKHCALAKLISPGTVVEHDRDDFGLVRATRSEGVELQQRFNSRDRLAQLSSSLGDDVGFEYDSRGFLKQADFGFCMQRFEYDALAREKSRELVGAGRLDMQYDLVGRLLALTFTPADPAFALAAGAESMPLPLGYTRTYDWAPAGKLSRQVDSLRGWRRYIHGPSLRLLGVDDSKGETQLFNYDGEGNRRFHVNIADNHQLITLPFLPERPLPWSDLPAEAVRRGGREAIYAYDPDGQLLEVRSFERSLIYEYDEAGYVVAKHVITSAGRETWRFEWNAFGHLVALHNPRGEVWKYRYDGMGRRVEKLDPAGKSVRYVWHEQNIVYELHGEQNKFYGYNPETNELLAVRDDQACHVVCDHIGSPSELISTDGRLTAVLSRDAWGHRLDSHPLPHVFPGQWRDSESALSYNYFRYYDPDIGRYLSPDPLGQRGGLNVYAYVPSPEQFTDPLGDISRRPASDIVVNSNNVNTGGRTQVNNPPSGPYVGGHDVVNGNRVDLGGATVTDIGDGNRGVVAHAYNGAPPGNLGGPNGPRATAIGSGATPTTWWHSEQNAMTAVLRGHSNPQGSPPRLRLSGEGPIRFDISRPPCDPSRGHGCMPSVVHGVHGQPSLAQQVHAATGRPVIVTWPDPTPADPQRRRELRIGC